MSERNEMLKLARAVADFHGGIVNPGDWITTARRLARDLLIEVEAHDETKRQLEKLRAFTGPMLQELGEMGVIT